MCDFLHAVKNFDERIISFSFFVRYNFQRSILYSKGREEWYVSNV